VVRGFVDEEMFCAALTETFTNPFNFTEINGSIGYNIFLIGIVQQQEKYFAENKYNKFSRNSEKKQIILCLLSLFAPLR
jgi:hypothetical protein